MSLDTIIMFNNVTKPYCDLSPFSENPTVIEGLLYPTVEHYYQSQKFTDSQMREFVRLSRSVKEANQLGHSRIFNIRDDWHSVRVNILYDALLNHFNQHPTLKELLMDTKDAKLIYMSANEYWGKGALNTGRNMYGFTLMRLRQQFQTEIKEE